MPGESVSILPVLKTWRWSQQVLLYDAKLSQELAPATLRSEQPKINLCASALDTQSAHLDRGAEEAQHLPLKHRHQQASEVQAHPAKAHATVHAVLKHRGQAPALGDARQLLFQRLQVEDPAAQGTLQKGS